MRIVMKSNRPRRAGVRKAAVIGLVIILLAGATLAAWKSSTGQRTVNHVRAEPPLRNQYVAMPHPADRATRRKAEYLARALNLPLVADSKVRTITVMEFRR